MLQARRPLPSARARRSRGILEGFVSEKTHVPPEEHESSVTGKAISDVEGEDRSDATPHERASGGCLRQDQVHVGYHGRNLTRDVVGRIGPGSGFPAKYRLAPGTRFAVTSTINAERKLAPPMLPAVNGWRYGYPMIKRKGVLAPGSGCWVPDDALGPDRYTSAWARGPAFLDFHVGRGKPRRKSRTSNPRPKSGRYIVRSKEAYCRFAPHSTSRGYLQRGDVVRAVGYWGFYTCIVVERSRSQKIGARVWVLSAALRRQKSSNKRSRGPTERKRRRMLSRTRPSYDRGTSGADA